jgi:hypothetical protein
VVGTSGRYWWAIALLLAARRQRSTELTLEHQREVAVEQRITEIYARAIDQLGNDQAPVRIGGLRALERLAQNNLAQRQTTVDVICAYLRMPYTLPGEDAPTETHPWYEQRRQELQVRLTAQRILAAHLKPDKLDTFWPDIDLDLTNAQLHKLNLTDCHIRTAEFAGAQFLVGGVRRDPILWVRGVRRGAVLRGREVRPDTVLREPGVRRGASAIREGQNLSLASNLDHPQSVRGRSGWLAVPSARLAIVVARAIATSLPTAMRTSV